MAVAPADLLTPRGRLDEKVIWPGVPNKTVLATLAAYLEDGLAQDGVADLDEEAQDRALRAWSYYRGKDEQFQRMLGQPASVQDSDEGSSSYLVTQMTLVQAERDKWLEEFEAILEEETGEPPSDETFGIITSYR
jgi:hypothetical protein